MNENSTSLPHLDDVSSTLKVMASCLQNHKPKSDVSDVNVSCRRVTFPEEDCKLITGYLEPANPWENSDCDSPEELIALYKASCEKHGTEPLQKVLVQIEGLDLDLARNECLSLKGESLVPQQLEPLEEIFKRVQFKTIDLEGTSLDDESSVAFFDMMEYYESGNHLNISSNHDIGSRGWHACSRMIKRTQCLERLDAKNIKLTEQHMPILSRALRIGTQLQILNLENCGLSGRPAIIMAAALRLNTSIKELYLADNDLGVTDAIQLASILRSNYTLQLLDVSNNNIQDAGVGHISDGLIDQAPPVGQGLSILVLWNNHLTRNCSKHFARAVALSKTLGMLNMGHNVLTNECLHMMKDSLQQNRTLLRLGMQSTHLSCEGAIALAECIADHPMLQRIDLRDNNLQVAGLMALTHSMKVNSSVTQLDLDDTPKKILENVEAEQYRRLVAEIRGYCSRNEQAAQEVLDTMGEEGLGTPERRVRLKSINSRKISLTCETLLRSVPPAPETSGQFLVEPRRTGGRLRSPAPSPIPSPISSPLPSPSRTRFSVSRVSESSGTPPSLSSSPSCFFPSPSGSRFHVSRVELDAPCPAVVTSPSGNNVTMGFAFDVKKMAPTMNSPVHCPTNTSIINSTPVPEIIVRDTSTGLFSVPHGSQDISVTVKHGMVTEDPKPTPKTDSDEDPDMEVMRIMENNDSLDDSLRLIDESETVKNVLTISPTVNQKPDSVLCSEGRSVTSQWQLKTSHDSRQGNGIVDSIKIEAEKSRQPVSNPSQRTRKISWIAPGPFVLDEKPQTSLEKLIGLFNPGSFFNKAQQCKTTPSIMNHQTTSNNNTSFPAASEPLGSTAKITHIHTSDDGINTDHSDSVERLQLATPDSSTDDTDIHRLLVVQEEKCPTPDVINNNNSEIQTSSAHSLYVKTKDEVPNSSPAESPLRPKQDENFNVSKHISNVLQNQPNEEADCTKIPSQELPPKDPATTLGGCVEAVSSTSEAANSQAPEEAFALPETDLQ